MLKPIVLLLTGFMLTTACSAQDPANAQAAPQFTDGAEYVTIAPPQRLSDKGKVEVVEVFSYGCIHCAHFAPDAEKLRKSLPAGVKFKLLPASFSPAWEPYARAFYAARQLGVMRRTHLKLFQQKFQQMYPINTLDELTDFYVREGVDRKAFLRAANSAETDRQLARGQKLIRHWGVGGTPTIVVDGKYRSNKITSYDQLLDLTRWLVQRELKRKGMSNR